MDSILAKGGAGLMDVIAEYLKKNLTESVRSGGLLIWLNKERQ